MGRYQYKQPGFMPVMPFCPVMFRNASSQNQKPKIQFPEEDMDGHDEMDLTYMTKMYPESCKKIYQYVKQYCDEMEHSKSCMYDDAMDKETIIRAVEKIYDRMKEDRAFVARNASLDLSMPRRYYGSLYKDLITSILLYEIFANRRRRYRRRRRYHPGGYYYFDDYYYPYDGY